MNADSESTRIDVTGTLVHVEDDRRDPGVRRCVPRRVGSVARGRGRRAGVLVELGIPIILQN